MNWGTYYLYCCMLVGHLHIIKLNVFVFKHTLVYFMFFFLLRVTGVGTCWGSVVVDAGAAAAGSDDLVLEEFHHFTVRRNVQCRLTLGVHLQWVGTVA